MTDIDDRNKNNGCQNKTTTKKCNFKLPLKSATDKKDVIVNVVVDHKRYPKNL